jgi:phosphoribosylanthranilate isomerase
VPTQIKICGLSSPETIDAAIRNGASHIGFVFFERSPRNITPTRALDLGIPVKGQISRVGVFVDPDDALLAQTAGRGSIDIIQLHGAETPERMAQVRRMFGLPVWKALGIASSADVSAARGFDGTADLLLFDAKPPKRANLDETLPGGLGIRFDWRLLGGQKWRQPWGLSGGLDANSVRDAMTQLTPDLVDVSSGVEDAPGQKSLAKIRDFIAAARS